MESCVPHENPNEESVTNPVEINATIIPMLVFGSMQDSIAPNEKFGDSRVQMGMRAVIGLPTAKTHIGDAVGGTNCCTVVSCTIPLNRGFVRRYT